MGDFCKWTVLLFFGGGGFGDILVLEKEEKNQCNYIYLIKKVGVTTLGDMLKLFPKQFFLYF